MRAIILSIGDELVLGQTVDTNSAFLSAELARMGIATLYHQTVGDDQAAIAAAITASATQAPLVLMTGGLGPTEDDLTRQALAEAMGVELVEHPDSLRTIKLRMAQVGRTMPARNRVQALHPRGSQIIANSCGTAPGIRAELGSATVYVTPGVPSELFAMFEQSIFPELQRIEAQRHVILTAKINTFGLGESSVAEQLGELTDRSRNPLVGTTVGHGVVAVRIRSEFPDADTAQSNLEDTARQIEHRLAPYVFGREEQTIQCSLIGLLAQHGRTMATAESCTGGLLGQMVTDVPGASRVYLGGWVTYCNQMKMDQLGVDPSLLAEHGAVSEQVACAMARGARVRSGADLAVAITGICGPGGGSADKPIGTVWIAMCGADHTEALLLGLPGERHAVRLRAAHCAIQMVRFQLLGLTLEHLNFGRRR